MEERTEETGGPVMCVVTAQHPEPEPAVTENQTVPHIWVPVCARHAGMLAENAAERGEAIAFRPIGGVR